MHNLKLTISYADLRGPANPTILKCAHERFDALHNFTKTIQAPFTQTRAVPEAPSDQQPAGLLLSACNLNQVRLPEQEDGHHAGCETEAAWQPPHELLPEK